MVELVPVLIIAGLIALNGLFVAAEFAIVSVPRATIEAAAARGEAGARRLQAILSNARAQDRFIATAQVGITIASLGLGMYGEHVLAEWLTGVLTTLGAGRWIAAHSLSAILSVAFLTYLHIVLGEMVPKTLALQRSRQTAMAIVPIVLLVQKLLYPLIAGLNGLGDRILRAMGVQRQSGGRDQVHTAEELELIVQESQAGGMLPAAAGEVVQELFAFGDRRAGEVMVPRVAIVGLPVGLPPQALAGHLADARHARYPVYAGDLDHILGAVHVKDLLRLAREGRALTADVLRPVPYLPSTARLDDAFALMRQARSPMAVVMDEHGGTAGLLTIEDLFEEVVGEIEETDARPGPIWQDAAGRRHVLGTVLLADLDEEYGTRLANDEVETISGLVLMHLNRPAQIGDRITVAGVALEVLAVEGRGVQECLVTPLANDLAGDPEPG